MQAIRYTLATIAHFGQSPRVDVARPSAIGNRKVGLVLTGVVVQRKREGILVIISGHGPFKYIAMSWDPFRLILDFPGGRSSLSFHELQVNGVILKRIRIGEHEDTLRLVFDLAQRVRYAVKEGINFMAVQFKP